MQEEVSFSDLMLYKQFNPNKNYFKSSLDSERIQEYLKYKKTRKAKGVVYTCITSNYDSLVEIDTHTYINFDWDYVCFTNCKDFISQKLVGIWEIFPLKYIDISSLKIRKWHKLHPHVLFENYKESIYIDSNINIITDKLYRTIQERKKSLLIPKYNTKQCIYEEYDCLLKRDLEEEYILNEQFKDLQKTRMPKQYGMMDTNIIYRKHNYHKIIKMMEEWWDIVSYGSARDYISLPYVLWKNKITTDEIAIDNIRLDYKNFYIMESANLSPVPKLYRRRFPYKNFFKSENDTEIIKQYLESKKKRNATCVIYTCITNDYDDLREIEAYRYVNNSWDYVCFTDNKDFIEQGQVGIWKILPLQYKNDDLTKTNRWHKLHPHVLFPDYYASIYIDANINILTNQIFKTIAKRRIPLLVPKHYERNCIYEEFEIVSESDLEKKTVLKKQLKKIKKSGMPEQYGLTENNIIFRLHNHPEVISIMEDWWSIIENGSRRDQLSFTYVLWKHGIKVEDIVIESARLDFNNFYVFKHRGKYYTKEIYGENPNYSNENNLKIHFVISPLGKQRASTRIRIVNLLEDLKKYFYKITIGVEVPDDTDVVVFQKINRIREILLAKKSGKFVCFDTDDFYLSLKHLVQLSDLVITSTEYLRQKLIEWNPETYIVENCLDIDNYRIPFKRETNTPPKIGWYGYSVNSEILKDLNIYDKVIKISEDGDVLYDMETIDKELKKLDYVIIPQYKTSDMTLSKTHNRMLKTLYLGIPTIVSDMPEYVRLANLIGYPKEYILSDLNEFKPLIEKLKNNEITLPNIDFKKIRKKILKNYHHKIIAKNFADKIYDSYLKHSKAEN